MRSKGLTLLCVAAGILLAAACAPGRDAADFAGLLRSSAPATSRSTNAARLPGSTTPPPRSLTAPTATTTPPNPAVSRNRKPSLTSENPAPAAVAMPNESGTITYYSAADNDPPGSRKIAYPGVLHGVAGGTGTFADPLTFAAGKGRFAPGTKVYVPEVQRYFVLEDRCVKCSGTQLELWIGPATDDGVTDCADELTHDDDQPYVVNPPDGLPVVPGELYQNGRCYRP
jgi:hypothetical protein